VLDLDADTTTMANDDLLAYQQELTRTRLAVNGKAREVQAELDRRAIERAEQRRREDAELGAVTKPPTQDLFGTAGPGRPPVEA